MGVAARGSFDLDQHGRHSGKSMDYSHTATGSSDTEPDRTRTYVPHVIEPSVGLDRYVVFLRKSASN